ncbi:hypothetical protein ACL02O_31035 [Micromonospora sp. MS34]|uniref:hypothetical protein n=1 Tax=Micromonospora sp. MS34 TaxID=3385971 RepID=UPI0039A27B43
MNLGRFGDVLVGTAGDVAGTVVDPREGLNKLRSALSVRAVATVAVGLLLGYALARSGRRA